MDAPQTFALIVGLDDYADPSIPSLRGAVEDALAWWRYLTGDLKVDPADIVLLTNPPVSLGRLARSMPAGGQAWRWAARTTRGRFSIDAAAEGIRQAEAAAASGGRGMVLWAGHGTRKGTADGKARAAVLAPGAATGGPAALVPAGRGGRQTRLPGLHVVLDVCFDSPVADASVRAAPAPPTAPIVDHDALDLETTLAKAGVVLQAAGKRGPAYEIRSGGAWRGALSVALIQQLERWQRRRISTEPRMVAPAAQPKALLERTRESLAVLGLDDQRPRLRKRKGGHPPLFSGAQRVRQVREEPTRSPIHRQVWAGDIAGVIGRIYRLDLAGNSMSGTAWVVSTNQGFTAGPPEGEPLHEFAPGSETWAYTDAFAQILHETGPSDDVSLTWSVTEIKPKDLDEENLDPCAGGQPQAWMKDLLEADRRFREPEFPLDEWETCDDPDLVDEGEQTMLPDPWGDWGLRLWTKAEGGGHHIDRMRWYRHEMALPEWHVGSLESPQGAWARGDLKPGKYNGAAEWGKSPVLDADGVTDGADIDCS